MKTITRVLVISSLFLLNSCAYIHRISAPKTKNETEKTSKTNQKNEIATYESYEVALNIEAKSNQSTVVDLNFNDSKASFIIEYQKAVNNYGGMYSVRLSENGNAANKVSFSGKSGFVKKYQLDDDFDDKAFLESGTLLLQGKTAGDYTVTEVNSMPFTDPNYAVFKVTNSINNKIIYGWINFIITSDQVVFLKMGYLDQLPLTVGG
jgi:hypothetical protein